MPRSTSIKLKVGDGNPVVTRTLKDATGTAINLTGCTVVIKIRKALSPGTIVVNRACTVSSPATAGIVTWQPLAADFALPGNYQAEYEITYTDTTKLTVPNDSYVECVVAPTF